MMYKSLKFLAPAFLLLLLGCAAWPLDMAITTSRKPQWGLNTCLLIDELGVKVGQQQIKARVWGFVKGRDWWGASTDEVWPPEPGVS